MEKQIAYNHIMRLSQNNNIWYQWLKKRYMYKCDIDDYLEKLGLKNIAVYGIGDLGECVVACLIASNKVQLLCGIDRNPDGCYFGGLSVVGIDSIPQNVDAIIVALPNVYPQVESTLIEKCNAKIFSIEEIIYKMGENSD